MSVDRFQSHVFVLPEDDANNDLANGFVKALDVTVSRRIQVLPASGGWLKVLEDFESNHVAEMAARANRNMVLLIDFDGREDRFGYVWARIPEGLKERVFILGAWSEPEKLKRSLGSYETIGRKLAKDCRDETNDTWGHDLLRHNGNEIGRLRERVRSILFR